ncbi:hypothetical protein HDV01_006523 [Terramyces sp. JEL0728]|nr:hypothetical protein HDV01_006523 [Terramyces sp. JEL0728]
MGKVNRVFITHLHGDHLFGLPGLVCTVAQNMEEHSLIQVYGPCGLRKYLRKALKSTYCRLRVPFVVHELLEVNDPVDTDELHPEELKGTEIYKTDNIWVIDEHVRASSITHTVPSIGYVIQEPDSKGKLRMNELQPILDRHKDKFTGNPHLLLKDFKNGVPIDIPGLFVDPKDYTGPDIKGRKLTILGDCNNADQMIPIAQDSTVLVHEATNAFLKGDADTKETLKETTISHGHSTPEMAGEYAKKINAKVLILNHFSSRYKGDTSEESLQVMEEIRLLAVGEFNEEVHCAFDYFTCTIPK